MQSAAEKIEQLIDKEAIRELVLLYSRAIDRQDTALLRDLYTDDATDTHGDTFDGSAEDYCQFIEKALPYIPYSGHHVCNHLVSVNGDQGNGEVYALAYHLIPDLQGAGGRQEDFMAVRYLDQYRRCSDEQWRFAKRVVTYDFKTRRPFVGGGVLGLGAKDPSYEVCRQPLFRRGPRT